MVLCVYVVCVCTCVYVRVYAFAFVRVCMFVRAHGDMQHTLPTNDHSTQVIGKYGAQRLKHTAAVHRVDGLKHAYVWAFQLCHLHKGSNTRASAYQINPTCAMTQTHVSACQLNPTCTMTKTHMFLPANSEKCEFWSWRKWG